MEAKLQQITHFIHHKYFWLFATLSSLATFNFYFIWKTTGKMPTLLNFLCWGSIFFLLWKKRNRIKFRGTVISSVIGLLFILCMVLRNISIQYYGTPPKADEFSQFFPFITLLGALFITGGIKRLIDYIPEIIIPLITGVSSTILVVFNLILNKLNIISNFDAQFSAFMLHYIGFKVQRQGPIISLSNGSVEVFPPCSSIAPLATILPMLTIFLFIYHASRTKKIYVCISVILCTIFLNAIRISWLAIILNQGDTSGFEYWHGGEGVGIFSNLIVFFGAGLSYQILNYSPKLIVKISSSRKYLN